MKDFWLQLLAIVGGALVLVYQLGRQHRDSLRLQKENTKNEQRLKLFELLIEKIVVANSALIDVSGFGNSIPSALNLQLFQRKLSGLQPSPVKYRSTELIAQKEKADSALIQVISAIEQREIIAPILVVYRHALSAQSERCRKAFQEFFSTVIPFLPVDLSPELVQQGMQPQSFIIPTEENIQHLEQLGHKLFDEYLVLIGFFNDLGREIQNQLLGNLFDRKVAPRKPLGPGVLAITSDPADIRRVEEHFEFAKHTHREALPSVLLAAQEDLEAHDMKAILRAAAYILNTAIILWAFSYARSHELMEFSELLVLGISLAAPIVNILALLLSISGDRKR